MSDYELDDFEQELRSAQIQAIGWTYAFLCSHLDEGTDIRKLEVPIILEHATKDLKL